MNDYTIRLLQLAGENYPCSQIIIMMGLELSQKSDPLLVKAMSGLAGGCRTGACTCGALTGGCCLLGMYGGRSPEDEEPSDNSIAMVIELVDWFEETYARKFGATICDSIKNFDDDEEPQPLRCFGITEAVFNKCLEILADNGYQPEK